MIAKLDILDTFEEVKIGVSYRHKGKVLESFPGKKVNFMLFKCHQLNKAYDGMGEGKSEVKWVKIFMKKIFEKEI